MEGLLDGRSALLGMVTIPTEESFLIMRGTDFGQTRLVSAGEAQEEMTMSKFEGNILDMRVNSLWNEELRQFISESKVLAWSKMLRGGTESVIWNLKEEPLSHIIRGYVYPGTDKVADPTLLELIDERTVFLLCFGARDQFESQTPLRHCMINTDELSWLQTNYKKIRNASPGSRWRLVAANYLSENVLKALRILDIARTE
ncbi:hypothetical protein GNI_036150 [Gregarina niphandrodes]|uniref:Uncharacterized protein n=1 Tax=Gregarina niphandrodes TaxID=110365 RepID=A0A023BAV9_GRENI|nr:hypothetical protein GNI_036150 [Gregarina niphandrodes]EZG78449.1 hypothetical protein GNI_036150 [Gregarina niphandrodes]|eukprot:XP_011129297.1 hypothetical protein GNI_036150 [Gregarina niphandrodes]